MMLYAWLNGTWINADDDRIPSQDEGHGLFETVCVRNGKLRFWEKHWARMTKSAHVLNISLKRDPEELKRASKELILKNKLREGAVKLICHQTDANNEWAIITREQHYTSEHYQRGFKVRIHPHARCLDYVKYGHKRINHVGPRIAKKEAQALGFNEALFINEAGHLCEGSYSNLFFVKEGELFTPSLTCGLLPGIARSVVIEWAKERGITVHEGQYTLKTLLASDEVFVTNALAGAMPIASIETPEGEIAFDLTQAFVTMELVKYFA